MLIIANFAIPHKLLSLARLPVPTLPLIAMKNLREAHHF